jgi:hypothetical protein
MLRMTISKNIKLKFSLKTIKNLKFKNLKCQEKRLQMKNSEN